MGRMYAAKCDICEELQVEKEAFNLKGRSSIENGVDKFYCFPCDKKLKTAAALGKGGLDDPLAAAGRLLEQKDVQIRNLELANAGKAGDLMGAADELRKKRQGGGFIPVMGLDFETQYKNARGLPTTGQTKTHALPAPQPKNKSKKKK